MSAFGRTRAWLRAIAMRGRMEREMHEEMAAHVAQATERFMARGMSERDALFAARREFGQLGAVQEDAREARGGRWLDSLAGDLKYAFRYFARTPLTTITIVLAQGDRLRRSSRLEATAVVVGCGVVALILASIGLYAMVSVAVGQRRREIGIRLALGAQARQVVRMFFRSGLRVTLVGLALGLPLSVVGLLVILRQTEDLPRDTVPAVAALVTLAVVGVASLASWLPARRASGVDPMVALRSE